MLRPFAVALAVLGFGAAQAADATFESLDKNADGQVSLDEASGNDQLFVEFKNLDTNKDGHLSKEEFSKYKAG